MRLLSLLPFLAATGCVSTTSQSEADRNYGRKMRKAEEREGRERRNWARKCRGHEDEPDCQAYTGFRADQVRR